MSGEANSYLGLIEGSLHIDPRTRSQVMSEVRGHVEERSAELRNAGLEPERAERQAIRDFGDPRQLAKDFYRVHSPGSTRDLLVGVMPHVGIATMFRFHLWIELFWVVVAVSLAVVAAAIAWRRGLPKWTAPWLGYALVLPAMTWVIAVAVVGYGVWSVLRGVTPPLPFAMYLAIGLWIPVSTGIVLAVARKTISYDWLMVSLAALPLPFLSAWLFLIHWNGGVLIPDRVRALETDTATSLVFLGLAAFTALFMKVGQRSWRLLIILALTPPLVAMAAIRYQTTPASLPVLVAIVLTLAFLMSPVLLDPSDRASITHRRAT